MRAADLLPTDADAQLKTGALLLMAGKAETAFRQAITTDPKYVPAQLSLAQFLWATGRVEEAGAALKATLALDPRNVTANRALDGPRTCSATFAQVRRGNGG